MAIKAGQLKERADYQAYICLLYTSLAGDFLTGGLYLILDGNGAQGNILAQLHLPAQLFDLRRKFGDLSPDVLLSSRVGHHGLGAKFPVQAFPLFRYA